MTEQIHIIDGQTDDILDFITMSNVLDDAHKKSLTDNIETYDFIALADERYSAQLEKRNRLVIPDEDGSLMEFVIFEVDKYRDSEGHKVQVFAHGSFLELKKLNVIYPGEHKGSSSQHAGRTIDNTGWTLGIDEGSGSKTLSVENHTSPYEMLKRVAREFDLELRFRVEHNGRKVTGRYVDLLERVGEWSGREVTFGKDLENIRRVEEQDIVTALVGLGPEDEDGVRMEVTVEDNDALQRWGWIDRHGELQHYIEAYEIRSERTEMTESEARQYTRTALNKRINTQVTYETTVLDLEKVPGMSNKKIRFGDTIKIKDEEFNPPLYLEARVFEQTRSLKRSGEKDIKLGDYIEYTEEEVNNIWQQLRDEIRNRVTKYDLYEYTYDKLTIDDKDETVFEDGKSFAEATGIKAEENAKDFAVEEDAKIKADAEEYADEVSKEEAYSALSEAKQYAVAKEVYEQQVDKIIADIEDRAPIEYVDGELRNAIDGLVVGGRNLVVGTTGTQDNGSGGVFTFDFNGEILEDDLGDSVTLSFKIKLSEGESEGRADFYFRDSGSVIEDMDTFIVTDKWTYHKATFTVSNDIIEKTDTLGFRANGRGPTDTFGFLLKEVQLEKGTKATDWSPAPEDIFDEIEKKADGSTVYTISEVDNMINNTVSKTQYETDQDDIVTQLESHGTRLGQNEEAIGLKADSSELDTVETELTRKIGNVEVKADEVTTSVSEVRADLDGLEIGGRNLLHNTSNDFQTYDRTHTWGDFTSDEQHKAIPVKEGETYTLRAYLKFDSKSPADKEVNVMARLSEEANKSTPRKDIHGNRIKAESEGYSTVTFTVPEGMKYVRAYTIRFNKKDNEHSIILYKELQLEKGNRATDWTPAPEDVDGAISDVSGRVESLDAEIRTVAGEVSLKASQSVVDSLEGRVSTAEGELKVLPEQIEARVTVDEAESIFRQEADKFTFEADQINFDGHVFGGDATFSGVIKSKGETSEGHVSNIQIENGEIDFLAVEFAANFSGEGLLFYANIYDHIVDKPSLEIDGEGLKVYDISADRSSPSMELSKNAITAKSSDGLLITADEVNGDIYITGKTIELLAGKVDIPLNLDIGRTTSGMSTLTSHGYTVLKGPTFIEDQTTLEGQTTVEGQARFNDSLTVEAAGVNEGVIFKRKDYADVSGHVITNHASNDYLVIYPHRVSGQDIFRIRSHFNRADYRTDFRLNNSGEIISLPTVNNPVTWAGRAAVGASSGRFGFVSSSERFKIAIEEARNSPENILDIDPKTWYDKNNTESYADLLTRKYNGEDVDFDDIDEDIVRIPGLIAEEVERAGLTDYVTYGKDGKVDGVQYDRLWTLLIPLVREQRGMIKDNAVEIEMLKERIRQLEEAE